MSAIKPKQNEGSERLAVAERFSDFALHDIKFLPIQKRPENEKEIQ